MAHTPGPWTVRPWAEKGPWIVQRGGEGGFLVEGLDDERAKADAFLIHAAPEMLEALRGDPECPEASPLSWLKSAIDELRERGPAQDCDDPDAYWWMVRELEILHREGSAAIAKAEGKP